MFKKIPRTLINLRLIVRIVGWLLIIEAWFLVFPTITCLIYGESDWLPFGATSVGTLITGLFLAWVSHPLSMYAGKRDGYLLTSLVWVVFSLFGLIPFLFCTHSLSFTDAFFEAMSGFTTTGASVIESVSDMSHCMHMWRAMTQWIGGLGIVLFTLALLPMLNYSGGLQLFNAEMTGLTHDKIQPRINQTAKTLWLLYIGLTVLLIFLLQLGPMNVFDSICHAFGTISTGGYSSHSDGMTLWHDSLYIKCVMIAFMFLGGVNFGLIYRLLHGKFKAVMKNDVFKSFVGIIVVMLIIFGVVITLRGQAFGWQSVTVDPLFHIVSTITSTGYSVANFELWGPITLVLTFVMMAFGGCAGSTAGGLKIDRIMLLFRNVRNELYRCLYPRSITSVKINCSIISTDIINKVFAFLGIFIVMIIVGGIIVTACGVPVVDSFFAVFSCLSNTGLGFGMTGSEGSYSELPGMAKWTLSFLMLIGRLEIFTVLVLLTPSFCNR